MRSGESRWPDGFACPSCGGGSAGERPRRRLWECRDCGRQTSVTAGTVIHGTRTPLQVWFWAACLAAAHDPGISAVQLQRQLGIKRHETAWLILHKLRRAMVAPERSLLRGPVEVDEFYVGGIEAGRGAGRRSGSTKAIVVVAVELRGQGSGRIRLGVVPDLSDTRLCGFVEQAVEPGAVVHTAPGEWLLPRAHRSISSVTTLRLSGTR